MAKETEFEEAYAKIRQFEQPAVYFRYGVRIGEFKGEPVLIPLTPQEFRESHERNFGIKLTDNEIQEHNCGMYDNWCSGECPDNNDPNNIGCHRHYDGPTSYCTCYFR